MDDNIKVLLKAVSDGDKKVLEGVSFGGTI